MAEQIPFAYALPEPGGLVEGKPNAHVIAALQREHWSSGRMAVIGAAGAGKTVLAQDLIRGGGVALERAGAAQGLAIRDASLVVIDDFARFIEQEDGEIAFFHLLNEAEALGVKVVIFSRLPLDEIAIKLADLRSRLGTFESFEIGAPDDTMMVQLLAKGFAKRGIYVKPDVIDYLSQRLERSYLGIEKAIDALDAMAMREKGKVNKARVRRYLDEAKRQSEE